MNSVISYKGIAFEWIYIRALSQNFTATWSSKDQETDRLQMCYRFNDSAFRWLI